MKKKNTHWELIEQNLAEFSEGKITNSKATHLLIYEQRSLSHANKTGKFSIDSSESYLLIR